MDRLPLRREGLPRAELGGEVSTCMVHLLRITRELVPTRYGRPPHDSHWSDRGRWPVPRSLSSSASQTRHRVSTCIAVIDICVPRDRSMSGTG